MAKVERFEDLVAWQRARALTAAVYRVSQQGQFARDRGLAVQIQRSAVSVLSNIAEGFERGSARDFHNFLTIAKASCAEVRSHLYVALDAGYLDTQAFDTLSEQAQEVARVVGGLKAALAKRLEVREEPVSLYVVEEQRAMSNEQ